MNFRRGFQKSVLIALTIGLTLFAAGAVYAQTNDAGEVAVLPSTLERISWGAILAGTVIAVVIQLAGNLLAIGLGMGRINPNPDYGEDVPSAGSIGTSTLVMMAISVLVGLFLGGYVAARFAGSPDQGDALWHGLMVWGLDTVITVFLLTTTLGSIFSGLSAMLGQGLKLVGSATTAVAQGTTTVVQGAANVAGAAAGAVGEAAKNVGAAVGDAASGAANTAQNAAQDVIESDPELQRLANQRNTLVERIQNEAMNMVNEAGVDTESLRYEAEDAAEGAKEVVKSAVRNVQQNPMEIRQIISDTFAELFHQGEEAVWEVEKQVSQVNRDKLVDMLATRGNMDRAAAEQQLATWEGEYNDLLSQGETAMNQFRRRSQRAMQETGAKAERFQAEAMRRLEDARIEAEHKAREAAEATTKALSRMALAAFAVLLIGAAASGIGGIVGAQETIPTVDIEDSDDDAGNIVPTDMNVPGVSTSSP
jgi:hypothetical protein